VSDRRRRLTTEGQVERLHQARWYGELCAACGRELRDDEPVYIERLEGVRGRWICQAKAPVGVECISDELRDAAGRCEPEFCAGCERPVYYRVPSTRRGRGAVFADLPLLRR